METTNFYNEKRSVYRMNASRRRHVLDLVPTAPGKALDFGCGQGELARELSQRGHRVTGVDIAPDAIAEAQPYLSGAFCFNVDAEEWPAELMAERFDTIVASELIEHLFDARPLLRRAAELLAPGGSLIVTTPNFLFWKNRLAMLRGRFRYTHSGLLDYGHVRLFTIATVRELFAECGLAVAREHHFYPNLYRRPYLAWLGRRWPGLFAYQMIFLLKSEGS